MFRELMPILEGRTLMLTLSRVDEKVIRVCVIPQRTKEATGENALCTPLTVTGTVNELYREFAVQLSGYTTAVVKLGSNLSAIDAQRRVEDRRGRKEERSRQEAWKGLWVENDLQRTGIESRVGEQRREAGVWNQGWRGHRCGRTLRCAARGR